MSLQRRAALWLVAELNSVGGIAVLAEILANSPPDLIPAFESPDEEHNSPAMELLRRAGWIQWDIFGYQAWLTKRAKP